MTAICTFLVDGCPVIVGDLLLTGPTDDPIEFSLPAVGNVRDFFGNSGWSILGLQQKISLISERCVIAWSGSYIAARLIIKELHDLERSAPLTTDGVRDFLSSHEDASRHGVSFVGWVYEEDRARLGQFETNADIHSTRALGCMAYQGTGGETLREFANVYETMEAETHGNANSVARAITAGLTMSSFLLRAELRGAPSAPTLLRMFGGGYEVALFADGRFQKVRDVTFIFWDVVITADDVAILPQLIVKQTYCRDILLLRSMRLLNARGSTIRATDEQGHAVLPMLPYGELPSREELASLSFNSSLFCHYFFVRNEGHEKTAIYTRVQHTANQSPPLIQMRDASESLEMRLNGAFVREIARELRRGSASP